MRNNKIILTILYSLITFSFLGLFFLTNVKAELWWETVQKNTPSIEELTKGKVKVGDTIDKSNVDLVKEYLSPGMLALVDGGLILKMQNRTERDRLDQRVPQYFLDYTEKYKGQAKVLESGTVYLKDGKDWPGGLPFIDPQTGLELMGNNKFGKSYDDLTLAPYTFKFVGKDGKIYKITERVMKNLIVNGRMSVPPIGAYPGMEKYKTKRITGQTYPIESKGLGMVSTRYYNDSENQDFGFLYLPAFKRTIRVSASTWQDSVGGSDVCYGDAEGFTEPLSYWKFKLLGMKYMFEAELNPVKGFVDANGKDNGTLQYTVNSKYPVMNYHIVPVHIVECTPVIRHIYSKKIMYCRHPAFWGADQTYTFGDFYDRAGALWKVHVEFGGYTHHKSPTENWAVGLLPVVYDIQSGHATHMFAPSYYNNGQTPDEYTLKALLSYAR